MDHGHASHPGRRTEIGQYLDWDRRNLRGSGTVRRREAAERLGEGGSPRASSSRAADESDGAERPDQGAGDEKGDHEPTDEPEGRFGIVEEPATGDERGGATGPFRHESGTSGREPRSSEHQPHDEEHEADEQLEKLATIAARLAVRVEVGEQGDTGEERDDPYHPRWGDDARRVTPSGDIWTRRSARRAETTAATGTPITTSTMSIPCSERSPGANGAPVNGTW